MRRLLPIFFTLIFTLLFLGCNPSDKKNSASLNGVLESVGSGWVLQIQDSTNYAFYDITSISCLPSRQAPLHELQDALSLKKDTLSLLKGVMTYKFTRVEQLPDLCAQGMSLDKTLDPMFNFEVFSETVKKHYAFMDLNHIDWPKLYEQQQNKLLKNSTNIGLVQGIGGNPRITER